MKKEFINYLFITLGCMLLAFGVVGFLSPNSIATGGTAGLAIIFHSIFKLPIGLLFGLINIPLLLVSIRYLGKYFALKSGVAIIMMGVFIDVLSKVVHLEALSSEPLLATLYGGVLVGTGLGLIFKGGGSAGGGTIIARIVTSKTSLKTGTVILILDIIVVLAAGLVFESIELALWSMISIFTGAKLIDVVLTGRPNHLIVHISSFKELAPLGLLIKHELGVSGTTVNGKDLGHESAKDIIFVVVPKNRLSSLEDLVVCYDPKAKMIVMEATQMLGVVNTLQQSK
ncbi:MAG: YitT family protein [Flavobacteriaceae bacterium]|nr:YitT family protein [Flavobacteriaceae bacterium]